MAEKIFDPDDYKPDDPNDPVQMRDAMQRAADDLAEFLGAEAIAIPELTPERMETLNRLRANAAIRRAPGKGGSTDEPV